MKERRDSVPLMMSGPADNARAIVLASSLSAVSPAPLIVDELLFVRPVYAVADSARPMLDLDAAEFRYRSVAGSIVIDDRPALAGTELVSRRAPRGRQSRPNCRHRPR